MKILRPVPANKRLPAISEGVACIGPILVNCKINNKIIKSYIIFTQAGWDMVGYDRNVEREVIEWYEEIEIESLFPDEDKIYNAGEAATNKQYLKTIFFQEGSSYFKNYILKKLQK